MDLFDISGRAYVITGSGHGLGRAMALEIARRGARVVVAARTHSEIEDVSRQIKDAGGTAYAISFDAADANSAAA